MEETFAEGPLGEQLRQFRKASLRERDAFHRPVNTAKGEFVVRAGKGLEIIGAGVKALPDRDFIPPDPDAEPVRRQPEPQADSL